MTITLIGLGNPLLGDDSVGWHIAGEVERRLECEDLTGIEVQKLSVGGLTLMEHMVGHEKAILVDAICTHLVEPGTWSWITNKELPGTYANSSHDVNLNTALAVGRRMGVILPETIEVCTVEIRPRWRFEEKLSPEVSTSIEPAVRSVLDHIRNLVHDINGRTSTDTYQTT